MRSIPLPKLACFDLTGTLINSLTLDQQVINDVCFRYSGKSFEDLMKTRDPEKSVRGNFHQFFGENEKIAYADYVNSMLERNEETSIFNGVDSFLSFLNQSNVQTVLITNRCSHYTHSILEYHHLKHLFSDIICCNDDIPVEKPNPDVLAFVQKAHQVVNKRDIWFVGDSRADIEMATSFGCVPVVFVGNSPREETNYLTNFYPEALRIVDYQSAFNLLSRTKIAGQPPLDGNARNVVSR